MADTLCGPANPLQTFQKHAQADRTLQQDRLVSRQQLATQNFRTENNAHAVLLDPEFEAFQAGQLPPLSPTPHEQLLPATQHSSFPPAFTPQPPPLPSGGWAADFAELNISSPTQQPASQSPLSPSNISSWHQDFQNSQQSAQASPSTPQRSHQHRFAGITGATPFSSVQQPLGYVPPTPQTQQPSSETRWKGKGRWQPNESAQDIEAFEREFAALSREAMQQSEVITQERPRSPLLDAEQTWHLRSETNIRGAREASHQVAEDQRTTENAAQEEDIGVLVENTERKLSANGLLPSHEVGFETRRNIPTHDRVSRSPQELPQEQHESPESKQVDEQLAHTAGQLLNNVADHRTQKFQQSSFLGLMRQFRDYEKKVEGDAVVDASVTDQVRSLSRSCEVISNAPDSDPVALGKRHHLRSLKPPARCGLGPRGAT